MDTCKFQPGTYTVTFDHIGRTKTVEPLTVKVKDADDLADEIYRQRASKHTASKGIEVGVRFNGTGFIEAGWRQVGTFTWTREDI